MSSFKESFISSGKQEGGTAVLWEEPDIVTRETCVPTSLNLNNLGKAVVLHFALAFLWLGQCQTQPADYWAQLCLCPVFHRLLIIHSPQQMYRITQPERTLSQGMKVVKA
jgi:hypothetical protein